MEMNEFSIDTIQKLALKYFDIRVEKIKQLYGEVDKNFYVKTESKEEYILKIGHPDSDFSMLEMQNEIMNHLSNTAPDYIQLPRLIKDRNGESIVSLFNENDRPHFLRLLTWVPGRLWANVNPTDDKLRSQLGVACANLNQALEGFEHPGAHQKDFKWDNANTTWVYDALDNFSNQTERETVLYFLNLNKKIVEPVIKEIRWAVNHNDINDHNILASDDLAEPSINGFIDFGDAVYTPLINELAIALAYVLMEKPDPIEAALPVIQNYHKEYPLTEKEITCLFPLIATRLVISVTHAAINKVANPDNEYLLVSEKPAWDLLNKLKEISPVYANYTFRNACGWEAVPDNSVVVNWLQKNQSTFAPVVKIDKLKVLDLSVGSLDLGHNSNFDTNESFEKLINEQCREGIAGIGKYNEVRPIYTTDSYKVKANEGYQWRSVHLGLDVFQPVGNPVFAPLDGVVHSFQNNNADKDYGPTIILEHQFEVKNKTYKFYTLYGHLSLSSIENLAEGMIIKKGQQIATMGDSDVNVGWPPHLHFQIILDMLGKKGDFPGVAFPHQIAVWKNLCPDPNLIMGIEEETLYDKSLSKDEILEIRHQHLGRNLSVSYKKPLNIVRAYRQYLYEANGQRFLDTVNNVPHVGHQHPRVVQAATRQIQVLNTNTRYLHKNIVQYAKALTDTLPEELSVCYFVNSGSEANELALRMAKIYSGQKDLLVLEAGYHGNTNACVDISSYKFDGKGGQGAPDWVHVQPMPDTYRGIYKKSDSDASKKYAHFLQNKIEELEKEGKGIAGFIHESILSCGGQIVLPEGYLKEAYQYVREAGGLCIADEVQVGVGRIGKHFWAFELQSVVPDIVTMGKPIGNGHPLGAVVTTRKVADAFHNGMEYFNTFGGNPVSCAIGHTVLKIVKEERLQKNALEVGDYLLKKLKALQKDFPIIGDVRGYGFFQGFELVKNQETLEPADAQTSYLANRARAHGILMSVDGPLHNVIKIKPPMVFDKVNADFLLEIVTKILKEDFMQV